MSLASRSITDKITRLPPSDLDFRKRSIGISGGFICYRAELRVTIGLFSWPSGMKVTDQFIAVIVQLETVANTTSGQRCRDAQAILAHLLNGACVSIELRITKFASATNFFTAVRSPLSAALCSLSCSNQSSIRLLGNDQGDPKAAKNL